MKIKKKVKRISSGVLCVLMLLTALPMTAITANAAAQAYIKYIDTEVYIGDVLNIIVGVNGGSTDETFTYQWQAKAPSISWVNLSDKTNNPDSKFSGVFTDHLKFQLPNVYKGEKELDFWKYCPTVWDESKALQGR